MIALENPAAHLWRETPTGSRNLGVAMALACPICEGSRVRRFQATLLRKYDIDYLYCGRCGLLQTEPPYWLEEAYSSAIADEDTGLVWRNLHIAPKLACLLYFCFERRGRYLDVAGGYGLLTRLMRDIGFDYYWSDPYCPSLLAKGFERETTEPPFTVITAFEVLEHVYNPLETIQAWLQEAQTQTLIFSTQLYPGDLPPEPSAWYYYTLSTGQHISFYGRRTLSEMAKRLSLNFYSEHGLHMFSARPINRLAFRVLVSKISHLLHRYVKRKLQSKMFSDFQLISRRNQL
jgi:hypothetical protein